MRSAFSSSVAPKRPSSNRPSLMRSTLGHVRKSRLVPIPRAVLLAGPSGSGKSTLAAHLGWPVLRLDDFYRDGDDPLLPRDEHGRADWDAIGSWNADKALRAVIELSETGKVEAPVYSISEDRAVGTQTIELGDAPAFIAEGLFADLL